VGAKEQGISGRAEREEEAMKTALLLLLTLASCASAPKGPVTPYPVPCRCVHDTIACYAEASRWAGVDGARIVGTIATGGFSCCHAEALIRGEWRALQMRLLHTGARVIEFGRTPPGVIDALWEGPDALNQFVFEQFRGGK